MIDNIIFDDGQLKKCLLDKKSRIEKYIVIMNKLRTTNVSENIEFRKMFNGFYKIYNRKKEFYGAYYEYLENNKNKNVSYEEILTYFFDKFGNIEKSFSSKLLATINPKMPVWDSIVLKKLNKKSPADKDKKIKLIKTITLYNEIVEWYDEFLKTLYSDYLVKIFDETFDNKEIFVNIEKIKKIDLILWSYKI